MNLPPISDDRFPTIIAAALVLVAVIGSSVMSATGVDKGQIASMMVTTLGFAGLVFNQSRIGARADRKVDVAASKVDEVRTTLVLANEARSDEDDVRSDQLNRMESTGRSIQHLVNGAHLAALTSNATMSARIAEMTSDPADRTIATTAAATLLDHQKKLAEGAGATAVATARTVSPLEQRVGYDPRRTTYDPDLDPPRQPDPPRSGPN
jgi:hypothetical protein